MSDEVRMDTPLGVIVVRKQDCDVWVDLCLPDATENLTLARFGYNGDSDSIECGLYGVHDGDADVEKVHSRADVSNFFGEELLGMYGLQRGKV